MSEPYLGELRLFPIGYAPRGWAACEGQTLAINQNQALFALLGTMYGGNGSTTFNLPDLRGRVPIHFTSSHPLGTRAGEERHTLTIAEMPAHNHMVSASNTVASQPEPTGNVWAAQKLPAYAPAGTTVTMNENSVALAGGSQAHNNMQPYLGVQFCIALQGIFPSRN
ncbi:phage tail protein [Xylanibacillus composti]|uniref:Tail Collar domain-containing protein n=1 Tax=Xylanibacillus composti TaxID=1572762 RepID=A0A8J4H704_9BACL|nr:tail fiber protein [Xylanibacillus composti]MDT9726518.1 phage tail protein [Xylanibacillus composti]GIQ69908.1 tail Collar domain-containing protein [Xylanibacillus composti]